MSSTNATKIHKSIILLYLWVNSLLNNKILGWSKLKAFTDEKTNVSEKLKFVLARGKNIVGKGENADYQHFLLFLQCFQKASISRLLKVGIAYLKS